MGGLIQNRDKIFFVVYHAYMTTIYTPSDKLVILEAGLFDRSQAREFLMSSQVEFQESRHILKSRFFVRPKNLGTETIIKRCTWYKQNLNYE